MTPKNLVIYHDKGDLVIAAAQLIAGAIRGTLAQQADCRLSLAGGSTPKPTYRALADPNRVGELPFEHIELLFGDERCVSPDDPDSNFAMAKQAFGSRFNTFKTVHRIKGELNRNVAAAEYESALASPIDVMLLGMGPDGHVASLFPGSPAFNTKGTKAMAVECPKPPPWRITMGPEVITAAKQVFVLATGKEKASALASVFRSPHNPTAWPAQLVKDAVWLVDSKAASLVMHSSE